QCRHGQKCCAGYLASSQQGCNVLELPIENPVLDQLKHLLFLGDAVTTPGTQ
ncbi:hypothetical protein NDU88_000713, partial [Pleurodeles waltl]